MNENIGHHVWVSKSVDRVDELLIDISKEMFVKVYDKINFILDTNFPVNKNKKTLI